jgi:hypothetical protein
MQDEILKGRGLRDLRPAPSSGAVLMSLLRQAGAGASSRIRVAGRDGLAPLIWLCRSGFEDVGYVRLIAGGPREPADVLLVLGGLGLDELEGLLAQHGLLREGGALILKTPCHAGPDGRDPVHAALDRAGYRLERCVHRHAQELHLARREPAQGRLPRAA